MTLSINFHLINEYYQATKELLWLKLDIFIYSSNLEESEKFDESFNHKACDEKGIPRTVDQPVNFSI